MALRNRGWLRTGLILLALAWLCFRSLVTSCEAAGPPPVITVQPLGQSVLQQGSVTFSVTAVSGTTITYHWMKDGSNVGGNGANASSYTIPSVQLSDAGNYSVQVQNSGGKVVSSSATLTVLVPPTILLSPMNQTVSAGQSAYLAVSAVGTAPLSYQWSLNGVALPGATDWSLTLNNVRGNQAGSYTASVTGSGVTATSSAATLTVTNPAISLSPGGGGGMTPTGFSFKISVPIGVTYVLLGSTNARNWVPISTNVATSATAVLTDTAALRIPTRYYRVMLR